MLVYSRVKKGGRKIEKGILFGRQRKKYEK
jgi:hypothetical protein